MEALERGRPAKPPSAPSTDLRITRLTDLLLQADRTGSRNRAGFHRIRATCRMLGPRRVRAAADARPSSWIFLASRFLGFLFKHSRADVGRWLEPVRTERRERLQDVSRSSRTDEQRLELTNRVRTRGMVWGMYVAGDYAQAAHNVAVELWELAPDYTHAWGDLFGGYQGLASSAPSPRTRKHDTCVFRALNRQFGGESRQRRTVYDPSPLLTATNSCVRRLQRGRVLVFAGQRRARSRARSTK